MADLLPTRSMQPALLHTVLQGPMQRGCQQDGTSSDDYVYAADVGDDDAIVLGGYSRGHWSGGNAGGADFVAVKLRADGSEQWRWQVC